MFLFAVGLDLCVVALLLFVNQAQNKCRFICTGVVLLFVFGLICACQVFILSFKDRVIVFVPPCKAITADVELI